MNVAALMTPSPVTVTPGHGLFILAGDCLVGIVTDRDLRETLPGRVTTTPDMHTRDAAHTPLHHRIGGVPVVDGGGKVTSRLTVTRLLRDSARLVRGRVEEAAQEARL
ncbi:MAG: CBS domain-containing protein [Deinococcota bacterium]